MKLSEFKQLLLAHPDKSFQLVLPDQSTVPMAFHVTEVAHIQKRFIDCGGKLHSVDTCQLQVWLGEDDDHRLFAGKMAHVLDLADKILPDDQDLDMEVEYEDMLLSQYPIAGYTVAEDAIVLNLTGKHTDCLAKESCCPPVALPVALPVSAAACCGSSCGC